LRGLKEKPDFYLTIGDDDYPDLIAASPAFHDVVKTTGARSTLRIGPGGHYWDTWQQAIIPALEWLAPKLDPDCGRR
jgi:enterochelin esterase family protein